MSLMMDSNSTELMKGSEITIRSLELLGVEVVFAYPGGQAIAWHAMRKVRASQGRVPANGR